MERRTFLSATGAGLALTVLPFSSPGRRSSSQDQRLRDIAERRLAERLGARDTALYRQRLHAELTVLSQVGLLRYLGVAHDLVAAARARGIAIFGGLGSASASLVCWSLGLSEVDPIAHDLPFESFVNWRRHAAGRRHRPLLMFAVCARRQRELAGLLAEQHGAKRVEVAAIQCDRAWYALLVADGDPEPLDARPERDRSLSLPKLLASDSALRQQLTASPEDRHALALALELDRNAAVNCGPDCLAGSTLNVSLEGAPAGTPGGALDPLSFCCPPLPALTALASARVPLGPADRKVWQMIGAGDTEDVVGLESHVQGYLRRFRPSSLSDLAAIYAVYRRAPMGIGLHERLLERKRTPAAPLDLPALQLHPLAGHALARTHGVLVFREQLLHVIHALSGLDHAEAAQLSTGVCKHLPREDAHWWARFRDGATGRGITAQAARRALDAITDRAGCLLSGAYALTLATLSLKMATLKAHAPTEFARVVREAYADV